MSPSERQTESPSRLRRILRRTLWGLGLAVLLVMVAVLAAAWWVRGAMGANLPQLDGELAVPGLAAPATVERDALGTPTIHAASRRDVALLTGLVHGQDRFFQMDVLRRNAAGELAELFGAPVLGRDRAMRRHRFAAQAERVVAGLPAEHRELLDAYAEGVNLALESRDEPFEYAVLRAEARPWKPADSILVLLAMFALLQDLDASEERALTLMHETLPPSLFAFLTPWGTDWDAPLEGEAILTGEIPQDIDLRAEEIPPSQTARGAAGSPSSLTSKAGATLEAIAGEVRSGSNSWAVAGSHTADGGALLANDMHLPLAVPIVWYRARLLWTDGGGAARQVVGLTLPGNPTLVVGSNGHVAWGFTNSLVDTSDLIVLEPAGNDPDAYLTPDGPRQLERYRETLHLRGGGSEELLVETTVWGPVVGERPDGRRLAVRALAAEPGAVNLDLLDMETAGALDEALAVAHRAGIPTLNATLADADGRVAWTLAGRLPRRVGFNGRLAGSWASGERRWEGLLPAAEVPRQVDPPAGRIWTANNRLVDGETLHRLGADGFGYVLGARARQIRDALLAEDRATVDDMLRLQLDDRALFLERWRRLLLGVLTPEAVAADPRRAALRELVEDWGGRAAPSSAGFRLVRAFRIQVAQTAFAPLIAACVERDPRFTYHGRFRQTEGPLWKLVSERPHHLLAAGHASWDALLLSAVDVVLDVVLADGEPLAEKTWGQYNTARIAHPLSLAVPFVGRWIDMPRRQLPGAFFMPRVQAPGFGASMRLALSPGDEANGYLHLPGGQSGNPRSPHYRDGFDAWANGEPTPLLPGPAVHTLRAVPESGSP